MIWRFIWVTHRHRESQIQPAVRQQFAGFGTRLDAFWSIFFTWEVLKKYTCCQQALEYLQQALEHLRKVNKHTVLFTNGGRSKNQEAISGMRQTWCMKKGRQGDMANALLQSYRSICTFFLLCQMLCLIRISLDLGASLPIPPLSSVGAPFLQSSLLRRQSCILQCWFRRGGQPEEQLWWLLRWRVGLCAEIAVVLDTSRKNIMQLGRLGEDWVKLILTDAI